MKLAYTVPEAAEQSGLGERQIREAVKSGQLRHKRTGEFTSGPNKGEPAGKILILHSALEAYLEALVDG